MNREDFDKHWGNVLTGEMPGATKFLGFELISFDSKLGVCEARFTVTDEMLNPGGNAQGGMISAMLDEVMSVAGVVIQKEVSLVPTLQMTTNFLRPVKKGTYIGRGEVLRPGRRALHTRGSLRDADGTIYAEATAACIPQPMQRQ